MAEKNISEKRMSFLPEDYVERRMERRTSLICLAMFAVMLAGVGTVYAYKIRKLNAASSRLTTVNVATANAAKKIEQLDTLKARRDEMLRKAQVTATLLERVPRTFLLADLINRMPEALSLLELNLSTKVVQPPRPAPTKSALSNKKDKKAAEAAKQAEPEPLPQHLVSISLVGVAPTDVQVAHYLEKLQQSQLLSGVNLIFSEETKIGDAMMRKFRVEMALSPAADVRTLEPAERKPDRPRDPIEDSSGLPRISGLPAVGGQKGK